MLPARHRLRAKRRIHAVQRYGEVFRSSHYTLWVSRRSGVGAPRVAVAVGRRVSKRAVDRNRVARWIREALKDELPKVQRGTDMRISATADRRAYHWRTVREDVRHLLRHARVL